MKKTPWIPVALLFAALPTAAQVVEVGDVSAFKEALKNVEAPAVPSVRSVEAVAAAPSVACPVLSLDGATVGRGMLSSDYTVKIAGSEVGTVTSKNGGYSYAAGGAAQAGIAIGPSADGRTATVTGCGGEVIGKIVEVDAEGASSFAIVDAAGKTVAESGWVSGTTWSLNGAGGSAEIKNDHWLFDRYALSMKGLDGRVVMAAAIMNNDALYRRSAERRRQNPHEPHGGRGDR